MQPRAMEGVGSPEGRVQPRLLASETLLIPGLRTRTRGEGSRPTHPSLSLEAGAGNSVNCHQLPSDAQLISRSVGHVRVPREGQPLGNSLSSGRQVRASPGAGGLLCWGWEPLRNAPLTLGAGKQGQVWKEAETEQGGRGVLSHCIDFVYNSQDPDSALTQ